MSEFMTIVKLTAELAKKHSLKIIKKVLTKSNFEYKVFAAFYSSNQPLIKPSYQQFYIHN